MSDRVDPASSSPFVNLPVDLFPGILQMLWEPKDVVVLNLVSKWVLTVNQGDALAALRVAALFAKYKGIQFSPNQTYTYRQYVSAYSHCDLIEIASAKTPRGGSEASFQLIQKTFPQELPDRRASSNAEEPLLPLDKSLLDSIANSFASMRPVYKLKALLAIAMSVRTDEQITRKFYNGLPKEMQNELKRQIWIANDKSSLAEDGVDLGNYFGDYILEHRTINGPLVYAAIRNYLLKFGVGPKADLPFSM